MFPKSNMDITTLFLRSSFVHLKFISNLHMLFKPRFILKRTTIHRAFVPCTIMVTTRQATRAASTVVPSSSSSRTEPPIKRQKTEHDSASVQEDITSRMAEEYIEKLQETKPKPKRKAKSLHVDSSQFLPRVESHWKVGAHVSAAGGVENAVVNAVSIGANAFALFLKSQRKWESPPLNSDSIANFKKRMKEYGYQNRMVLPHGSYLINLGNPDREKREKSYSCFLDDLKRCEALDLELYNFHPGSTVGQTTVETSLGLIAECINRAHKETQRVTVVLENMAGAGNIIGSDFAHLAGIIKLVEDQSRVGVCLDTCHAFAAGYDIRTKDGWNATMSEFDQHVGLKYLCGMHLNDSKTTLSSKKDRHENIGVGHLGLVSFQHILQDPRTQNIPLILETPSFEQAQHVWGTEIAVLQRISAGGSSCEDKAKLDFDVLGKEIRAAVKLGVDAGQSSKSKNTKKVVKGKPTGKSSKRKRVDENEHQEEGDMEVETDGE